MTNLKHLGRHGFAASLYSLSESTTYNSLYAQIHRVKLNFSLLVFLFTKIYRCKNSFLHCTLATKELRDTI